MSNHENESLKLFVAGILMTIGYFVFDWHFAPILYVGLVISVLGLFSAIYPIVSERKRFASAQLDTIDKMSGKEFEQYTAFLLRKLEFNGIRMTKAFGDQGIDVIASKNGCKHGIQCKRWKNKVGNKAVQEVYAGIGYYSLDKAIVLTNSYFTESAKQLAAKLDVELWDRSKLIKMIETVHTNDKN